MPEARPLAAKVDRRSAVKNSPTMIAMIDIPDELYHRVSARVASLGRRVPEVTAELYTHWLAEEETTSGPTDERSANVLWLEQWFHSADQAMSLAPEGPPARELLAQDRNRVEQS
jgi:hypothetical protein